MSSLSSHEQTHAQWCTWIALVCFSSFLLLCGYIVWQLHRGAQIPNQTIYLSAIFILILITAVPTVLYRFAYGKWPEVPHWYNRAFQILFGILALYILATSAGLM